MDIGTEKLAKEKLYKNQNVFYKAAYDSKETPWSTDGKPATPLVRAVKKISKNLKNRIALDLGCGEGRHTLFLESAGFKVIGLELQANALKRAKGRGRKSLLYLRADLFLHPFKEGRFDLLVDYGVFHHIRRRDTDLYMRLITSLLRPGGYLLLSCFGRNFRHPGGKRYPRGFVFHNNHYDRFSSKTEIRDAFGRDFDIDEIESDSNRFLNSVMRRKG
jgi:SAM-dependent methyltransferase